MKLGARVARRRPFLPYSRVICIAIYAKRAKSNAKSIVMLPKYKAKTANDTENRESTIFSPRDIGASQNCRYNDDIVISSIAITSFDCSILI